MTVRSSPPLQGHPAIRTRLPAASWPLRSVLVSLLLLALIGSLGVAPAWAVAWPGRASDLPTPPPRFNGHLQEQPPPLAVQQLQAALDRHDPRVTILSPPDGSLVEAGDWDLRLQVDDWPLVDAGPLGLGPHLLVLIDDQPPFATTSTNLTLPALTPGSHRIAVVAARPWGEAVKQPGALAQARVHRVAPDPQGLPAPDGPQLLAVAPPTLSAAEPILVDWLMPQAPLQHLNPGDTGWRLRLTLNGDSVLVDRQQPLWLAGWLPGSNALVMDLLNGRGEPLNPPFTSKVLEVRLDRTAPRPVWHQDSLDPLDLARLLGEAPASLPEPAPQPDPEPLPSPAPADTAPATNPQEADDSLEASAVDPSAPSIDPPEDIGASDPPASDPPDGLNQLSGQVSQ